MIRKTIATLLVCFAIVLVQAHEFWLQPRKFRYKNGEEMTVDFMVGEKFEGKFWDLNKHRVEKLEMHIGNNVKNLLKIVKPTAGANLLYKFDREGTHLLALESNAAFIELEGEKFTAYLKEDGLDEVLDARTRSGELQKSARENYRRFAKLLVQCGSVTDDTYRKRVGFRYEIVPQSNPYKLTSGDYLECRVFWENRPAAHALVKVWSHIGNRIFLQNIYTEDDGTIKFPISSRGPWMVSSVKMIPSAKEGADYESMWASLTFEIE